MTNKSVKRKKWDREYEIVLIVSIISFIFIILLELFLTGLIIWSFWIVLLGIFGLLHYTEHKFVWKFDVKKVLLIFLIIAISLITVEIIIAGRIYQSMGIVLSSLIFVGHYLGKYANLYNTYFRHQSYDFVEKFKPKLRT